MLPYVSAEDTEYHMVLGRFLQSVIYSGEFRGTLSSTWAVALSRVPPPPTQQGSVQTGPLLRIRSQRITQIQQLRIIRNSLVRFISDYPYLYKYYYPKVTGFFEALLVSKSGED